jgi:hypothetical protein
MRRQKRILPYSFQREHDCADAYSEGERVHFCGFKPLTLNYMAGSLRKLIQAP